MFRDEEKGLMLRLVNCANLIELLPSGDKAVIQKPEQIEILKKMMLDYNQGALDYDNLELVAIDAGSGGGGFDIAAFLLNDWTGYDGKRHLGIIDLDDPYQKLQADDHESAIPKLRLVNFKKSKVEMYERAQAAINQGLVIFPNSLNVRNEMEITEMQPDGTVSVRYEKCSFEEMNALIQIDLMKEELVGMEKQKRPNGTIVFELSNESKSRNMHDDRIDTIVFAASYLMEKRALEVLALEEKPSSDFKNMFEKQKGNGAYMRKVANSFNQTGGNPFLNRKRPN